MRGKSGVKAAVAVASMLIAVAGSAPATARTGGSADPVSDPSGEACTYPDDFNGDGYSDLAVGAPFDDVVRNGTTRKGAGAVVVLYGSPSGLTATGEGGVPLAQVLTQDTLNVADKSETGDHFGWALARGDFDSDCYTDLAIGVPGEDLYESDQGAVTIVYGSTTGLVGDAQQPPLEVFDPGGEDLTGAHFGSSLAVLDTFWTANFSPGRDTKPDLAVGMPGYGGHGGVEMFGGDFMVPNVGVGLYSNVQFPTCPGCLIGTSLAGADLNPATTNHFSEDLVVGAPGVDRALGGGGMAVDAGGVYTVIDAAEVSSTAFFQDAGFRGVPESGDKLGQAVAAGDVTGDGIDDILAAAPGEDLGSKANAGIIEVAPPNATQSGYDIADAYEISRKSLSGSNLEGARFGASLVYGRLANSFRDLMIGAPGETVGGDAGAGAVWIDYGVIGIVQHFSQDSNGINDQAEPGDGFGSALSFGDFDRDGNYDLVVGVPREDLPPTDGGAVAVIYGTTESLDAAGDQRWTQDSAGVGETAQAGDRFGFAVR